MHIEVLRPLSLVLFAIFVPLVIFIGRKLRMSDNYKKRKYMIFRLIMVVCLILAMAGITVSHRSKITTTIFLMDCSDSMESSFDEAEEFLTKQLQKMPAENKMGIVAFGGDSKVEQFITENKSYSGIETTPVKTATNIEGALKMAISMFPDDSAKRVVIISDGIENEGSVTNLSGALTSDDIDVQVYKLEAEISDEVYVDDLTIPDTIKTGDEFAITVNIISNVETDAEVALYAGRDLKDTKSVKLDEGENQFVFYDKADETGYRDYRVRITADKDTNTVNNEYSAYADIQNKDKILVIEGQNGWGDAVGAALSAGSVDYDIVTPAGVPVKINDMLNYKSIMLVDVYYDDLPDKFTALLDTYVKDYAGGLIISGGENSFALGDYQGTVLEDLSPVNLEPDGQNQVPKMAFYVVMDKSGSMEVKDSGSSFTALDLAKSAAIKAVENLRETDEVGILAFDEKYNWVVDPTEASDKDSVEQEISSIAVGGGTSIYPALQVAINRIENSDATIKHIILMTDGEDDNTGYYELTSGLAAKNITLSTVAVGADSATNLLKKLAELGGGRYYYTDMNNLLPRIFAKEVYLSMGEYLINEEFTPVKVNDDDMLSAFEDGTPSLLGYIATSKKSTSTVLLNTDKSAPLLAKWQVGLGTVVAFTSDLKGEWSSNYTAWDNFPKFVRNMVDATISQTNLDGDSVSITQSGNKATVSYTTDKYSSDTKIAGIVTDEDGNQTEVTLSPSSPGVYEAQIPTENVGVYNIALTKEGKDGVEASINEATAMQYSSEYKFYDDSDCLEELVSLTDGNMITDTDKSVFKKLKRNITSPKDLTYIFIIIALIIFMVDVIDRRLDLDLFRRFVLVKVSTFAKKGDGQKKVRVNDLSGELKVKASSDKSSLEPENGINKPEAADNAGSSKKSKKAKADNVSKASKAAKSKNSSKDTATNETNNSLNALLDKKNKRQMK